MAYQGVPGWVRRRKIKTGQYVVLYNGEHIAIVQLEGRYGADAYPWGWYTVEAGENLFGLQTGNGDTLSSCIEQIYWKFCKPLEDSKEIPDENQEG